MSRCLGFIRRAERRLRIIFAGTSDFAVPSLEALIASPHDVVAVVTQPDKPKGRGREMQMPPVKEIALAHSIPVLQPEKIRKAGGGRGDQGVRADRGDGRGGVRTDRASRTARLAGVWLHQRPRIDSAQVSRRGADPARDDLPGRSRPASRRC